MMGQLIGIHVSSNIHESHTKIYIYIHRYVCISKLGGDIQFCSHLTTKVDPMVPSLPFTPTEPAGNKSTELLQYAY